MALSGEQARGQQLGFMVGVKKRMGAMAWATRALYQTLGRLLCGTAVDIKWPGNLWGWRLALEGMIQEWSNNGLDSQGHQIGSNRNRQDQSILKEGLVVRPVKRVSFRNLPDMPSEGGSQDKQEDWEGRKVLIGLSGSLRRSRRIRGLRPKT